MDQSDLYRDYSLIRGADFRLAFALTPLDLTGATASLEIDTLAPSGLAMDVTISGGAVKRSDLVREIEAADTADYDDGLYGYRVMVTYPGGAVLRHGHGKIAVSS